MSIDLYYLLLFLLLFQTNSDSLEMSDYSSNIECTQCSLMILYYICFKLIKIYIDFSSMYLQYITRG